MRSEIEEMWTFKSVGIDRQYLADLFTGDKFRATGHILTIPYLHPTATLKYKWEWPYSRCLQHMSRCKFYLHFSLHRGNRRDWKRSIAHQCWCGCHNINLVMDLNFIPLFSNFIIPNTHFSHISHIFFFFFLFIFILNSPAGNQKYDYQSWQLRRRPVLDEY